MIIFFISCISVLLLLLLVLMKNKKVRKIAVRNLFRKKTQTVLIILGSMVGTAMITGSLGLNDSMNLFLYSQIENELGTIDEIIYKDSKDGFDYFNKAIGEEFISQSGSRIFTDGAIGVCYLEGKLSFSASKINNPLSDIAVKIIAFDFKKAGFFNLSGLEENRLIVSESLKEKLYSKGQKKLFLSQAASNLFDFTKEKMEIDSIMFSDKIPQLYSLTDDYSPEPVIFIDTTKFYEFFPEKQDMINLIFISNTGDWLSGSAFTNNVVTLFEKSNLYSNGFKINPIKANRISEMGNANIGYLFLFLSFFSILAGIFLMMNTYGMMAKERESELGMLRAIGFFRSDINKLFLLEGVFYNLFSSLLGVLSGVFLSKYILSTISGFVFKLSSNFLNALGSTFLIFQEIPELKFYISNQSIIISFFLGIFISMVLLFVYSRRISRFKIVDAIRGNTDFSEKPSKHKNLLGVFGIIVSILIVVLGLTTQGLITLYLGLSIFAITISLIIYPKHRTLSNIIVLVIVISAIFVDVDVFKEINQVITLILIKPLILLSGLFFLFTKNLDYVKRLFSKKPLSRIFDPFITKISFAYPHIEKKKTRLIISIYTLVIFIITIVTVIPYSQQMGIKKSMETLFWGYEAFVPGIFNTQKDYKEDLIKTDFVKDIQEIKAIDAITDEGNIIRGFIVGDDFSVNENNGTWYATSEYSNINTALKELENDKTSYIIFSGRENENPNSGSLKIELSKSSYNKLGTFFFDNITFFQGVIVSEESSLALSKGSRYDLIKLAGETEQEKKKNYEKLRTYINAKGILAITNEDIIEISEIAISGMVKILNGFLYFGMIIGIIGISITMYRAFYDRKKVIGMLKAIGFTKRQIFDSFILETSVIVITGLLIGIISGLITSEQINSIFSQVGAPGGQTLYIPHMKLIVSSVFFYIASILAVFIPSYNASKIKPAEALKSLE